jgi:hypothetical protein
MYMYMYTPITHSLTQHFLTHPLIHPSIHSLLYSSSNNSTELLCMSMFHVRAGIPSACVRTGPTRTKEKKKTINSCTLLSLSLTPDTVT